MFKNKQHRLSGHAAAAQSPNTPAHLRQHQARLAKGATMPKVISKGLRPPKMSTSNTTVARGGVPQNQTVGGFEPVEQREPEDTDVYQSEDDQALPKAPGVVRAQPSPAGTRPMTVGTKLPRQGSSGTRTASVRTPGQRGPGIQRTVAPKKLRNVLPGGPKKYGGGALYGF